MSKGITNIEEVIALTQLVLVEVCKKAADGFQVSDLVAFLEHPDFEAKLQAAVDGLAEVQDEAKDIGIIEGITLAKDLQKLVTEVVAAFKKPA